MGITTDKPFSVLASNRITGVNYLSPAAGTYLFPLFKYEANGDKYFNISSVRRLSAGMPWTKQRF